VAEDVPDIARKLAAEFWPGPLTLVLNKRPKLASNVSAGLGTVAVRMPNHKIPLALIDASSLPIAAPSANLFTRPSPTTARHVLDDLDGRVDIILDGGSCPIGLESTVLDLTSSAPTILRPGGVPVEALKKWIPNLRLAQDDVESREGHAMPSPGMLAKHYSPNARLLLFAGNSARAIKQYAAIITALAAKGYRVGVMVTDEDVRLLSGLDVETAGLGSENDLSTIGQNLFAQMRKLDKANVDLILIRAVRLQGLGLAIWDRLLRASERNVFDLNKPIDIEQLVRTIKR
jgi:L-threonylcarbamoyladenylate synthase